MKNYLASLSKLIDANQQVTSALGGVVEVHGRRLDAIQTVIEAGERVNEANQELFQSMMSVINKRGAACDESYIVIQTLEQRVIELEKRLDIG